MLHLSIEAEGLTKTDLFTAMATIRDQIDGGSNSGCDSANTWRYSVSPPQTAVERLTRKLLHDNDPLLDYLRAMKFEKAVEAVQKLLDENTKKDEPPTNTEAT